MRARSNTPRDGVRPRARLLLTGVSAMLVGLAVSGCDAASSLDPKGPRANDIANLGYYLLATGAVVWLIVVVAMVLALLRKRGRRTEDTGQSNPVSFVLWAGAIIPAVILGITMFVTLLTVRAVARDENNGALVVEVTGHQWWWEIRYPDQKVVTANEIHIPVGRPVEVRLKTNDVIHSFWVPQLQGKMDLIPGQDNTLWLKADQPGDYRGVCAEYCGLQHANMAFHVFADQTADFDRWVKAQQEPAARPTDPLTAKGQQVFLGSGCVYCHNVDGTSASGTIGPDLTHVANRTTLGAGAIENSKGAIAGWLIDPQQVKPGNLMPGTRMSGEDLQALLAYLETLK